MPKSFLLTNKRYKSKHRQLFQEHPIQYVTRQEIVFPPAYDFMCPPRTAYEHQSVNIIHSAASSPKMAESPPLLRPSVVVSNKTIDTFPTVVSPTPAIVPPSLPHEDSDSSCSYTSEKRPVTPSIDEYGLHCREHVSFLYDLMTQSPTKATCRDNVEQSLDLEITCSRNLSEEFTRISQIFAPLNDVINRPLHPFQTTIPVEDPEKPGLENYSCVDCGKCYSTSSNLARHRQTHRASSDKKARKCPHCEKVYVSMPAYSMHVRTHNQGCECQYCGKRFSRPWLLQGHVRTHTGEKPFACPKCGKSFADKSNLRAHIQTHSADKPFVCGRCGKAFALKSYLYKHEESSCMRGQRFKR